MKRFSTQEDQNKVEVEQPAIRVQHHQQVRPQQRRKSEPAHSKKQETYLTTQITSGGYQYRHTSSSEFSPKNIYLFYNYIFADGINRRNALFNLSIIGCAKELFRREIVVGKLKIFHPKYCETL